MKQISLDPRIIYLLVLFALAIPLLGNYSLPPARMSSAEKAFSVIDSLTLKPGQIAFVSLDFGPSTKAENAAQAEVTIEHLMRRRIPFALFTAYDQADPFLRSIPEAIITRLKAEDSSFEYLYGKDWVNLGYRPGVGTLLQSIPKSENLAELFDVDARGNRLTDIPLFREVKKIDQIGLLAEFTGLVGMLDAYLSFFQSETYRPQFIHGCTSITIPEAYIYMDSGQLNGLFEGIAGAAWYSKLLQEKYTSRKGDSSRVMNTMLGVAHLVIIALVIFGNLTDVLSRRRAKS